MLCFHTKITWDLLVPQVADLTTTDIAADAQVWHVALQFLQFQVEFLNEADILGGGEQWSVRRSSAMFDECVEWWTHAGVASTSVQQYVWFNGNWPIAVGHQLFCFDAN